MICCQFLLLKKYYQKSNLTPLENKKKQIFGDKNFTFFFKQLYFSYTIYTLWFAFVFKTIFN